MTGGIWFLSNFLFLDLNYCGSYYFCINGGTCINVEFD